jgi:hypothetical protein
MPKKIAPLQSNAENVIPLLPSSEKIPAMSVGTAKQQATSSQLNTEQVHLSPVSVKWIKFSRFF